MTPRVVSLPLNPRDRLRRPLHDLRISVMDRCNFRCTYCMPRETFHEHYKFLSGAERLSFDEIVRLVRQFAALGVKKLRLTGGEPLLRTNLADLVGELSAIDGIEDIALTTNGVLLDKHAAALKANGLTRITVSLDSLDEAVFQKMNGGFSSTSQVLTGIGAARDAGLAPIKINAVVQRGINDHTVLSLLEHFRGTGITVRLIEYMDVGSRNHWSRDQVVPSIDLIREIGVRWPIRPVARGYKGEVADRYAYDDGAGEIGFISSVSAPFCGDCSRARLSSEGMFYTCLFAQKGDDLRALVRGGANDLAVREAISAIWTGRADRYSELRAEVDPAQAAARKIEMYYIGG